jgi:hypothetical protein
LKGENGKMKIKAEKTWIMMALLLVSVSSMIKAPNSETQEGAHALNSYSTSSAVPATEWNETYGGQSNDAAHSLVNTSDGYALAGSTFSYGAGSFDFWLVKTNLAGTELWNKTYGGGGDDEAYSVIQTNDSGYAVAGFTNSYGNGGNDFWLVKTDSGGNKVWSQPYGGTSEDKAYSVIQTNDSGYAVAGFTNSYGNGGNDFWLVKTDSGGNKVWSQPYGGTSEDKAYSVIQTNDGGYALAGSTNSFGAGGNDFWLVKTDTHGSVQWNMTYGRASNDEAYSVIQTSDGGYALGGFTNSSGHGGYDFWLVKTDSTGTELWNKTYGGPSDDEAYSIVQTGDGGYVLAGFTNSFGAGSSDFWLVKTDASGNLQWDKPYGGQRDDKAYCVQVNGGGYAMAGYTYSISAGNDAWLVKTAAVYHTLNITVTAGGTIDPTPGTHTYPNGTVVTVTASPIAGYFFDHWELDGNSTATFNSINVSMDIDHQLKAVFAPLQCTLNITVTVGGTTDPTPGTHTYPYGQFANVTAYPDYGNYLDHWVVDGVDTNSTSNPIHVPMHMNHTLNAVFRCPHDIAVINIAAQKTCVGQNQSTNINYTVANVGKSYEVFVITLYTNFTENSSETVLAFIQVSLVSGYNLSSTLPWSTSGFSKGNYTLIGSVEPVGNETITADNTFVSGSILVTIPGDLSGDLKVTLSDLVILANAYGSTPGDIKWNPDSDINGNGKVDLPDLVILALNYGKTDP